LERAAVARRCSNAHRLDRPQDLGRSFPAHRATSAVTRGEGCERRAHGCSRPGAARRAALPTHFSALMRFSSASSAAIASAPFSSTFRPPCAYIWELADATAQRRARDARPCALTCTAPAAVSCGCPRAAAAGLARPQLFCAAASDSAALAAAVQRTPGSRRRPSVRSLAYGAGVGSAASLAAVRVAVCPPGHRGAPGVLPAKTTVLSRSTRGRYTSVSARKLFGEQAGRTAWRVRVGT
jgi:hypothetical protein